MPVTRANFDDVVDFHKLFDIAYSGPPRTLPEELKWRIKFLQEELDEYKTAVEEYDFVVSNGGDKSIEAELLMKQFDGLLDIVYVALGTAHLQGFPWQHGWFQVQYANMTKKRAKDGEGRGTGDIIKPEGWQSPDEPLKKLLAMWAERWDKPRPVG